MTVNSYCTRSEIYATLVDINGTNTKYDTLFDRLIDDASRAIDRATKRYPGYWYVSADSTMYYGPDRISGACLRIDDLASAPTSIQYSSTSQLLYDVTLATTDYWLEPVNAGVFNKPYNTVRLDILNGNHAAWLMFPHGIKVVGKFGYSTAIPGDIRNVTIMQVGRWFNRAKQGFQSSHTVTEGDSKIAYTDKLDSDLEQQIKRLAHFTI